MPGLPGLDTAEVVQLDDHGAFRLGEFSAYPLTDDLSWGLGDIHQAPEEISEQRRVVVEAIRSLEAVDPSEADLTGCTDGRRPELEIVRKQLVGASGVIGFVMAETVGEAVYGDPTKPLDERAEQVMDLLVAGGIRPATHEICGAKGGYVDISRNVVFFALDRLSGAETRVYRQRNEILLGDLYNRRIDRVVLEAFRERTEDERYGYAYYHPDILTRAILNATGPEATYNVQDDGRGHHGHVEESILRLRPGVGEVALNTRALADITNGRQVFGNNDGELNRLAAIIGQGDSEVEAEARHAGEHFTNAGHGTLAKNLPTWVISRAAA